MKDYIQKDKQNILQTYKRLPVCFVKGDGNYLYDENGKEYTDFLTGISVSVFGHSNKSINTAIKNQVDKLLHVSNLFYTYPQIELAEKVNEFYGGDSKIFFANSGAEANECAIKLARKYKKSKYEIITFKNSFHGRTLATLTATEQKKIQDGYDPLPEGFKYAEFNDIKSVKKLFSDKTTAVMIELIQGEGGVNVANKQFVKELVQFCKDNQLLFIVDEIQTGIGRTGKMFAYEHFDIKPDIVTLAKAFGGGLPLGAVIVNDKYQDIFSYGSHGSTFGGNLVACSAALAGLNQLTKERFLYINEMAKYFGNKLEILKQKYDIIKDVRGIGLMLAIELVAEPKDIVLKALEAGFIINVTQNTVIRFLPSYFITKKNIDDLVSFLNSYFSHYL